MAATTTPAAWGGVILFALAAVAGSLAAALGTSGFARGMLIGAALVLLAAGGALLGIAIRAARTDASGQAEWRPSRDQD